jgi:hypothetical protein
LLLMIWSLIAKNNRVLVPLPPRGSGQAFVEFLKARMEAGQFRAVIDRRYPLDEIADAYRYVETGQKVGIVVINVAQKVAGSVIEEGPVRVKTKLVGASLPGASL